MSYSFKSSMFTEFVVSSVCLSHWELVVLQNLLSIKEE